MAVEEHIQKALGQDRQVVTRIDPFRASEYYSNIISGATNYLSGFMLLSVALSSVVRIRPLNFHFCNNEGSHCTVVLRDGVISGNIVAGPYILNPRQERVITPEELIGRRFNSGMYCLVISGPAYSAGINVDIGFVNEPDPTSVGGYLE